MGGAKFAMAGARVKHIVTRPQKGLLHLLLVFGGPLFVAIVIAFIYRWVQVENER